MQDNLGIEFNFHSLRHIHATILMENGAKVKDVRARLGHSRSAITIDTYSHLTQKMQNESVDIFEQAMRDIKYFATTLFQRMANEWQTLYFIH